jgi:hypothetical protein
VKLFTLVLVAAATAFAGNALASSGQTKVALKASLNAAQQVPPQVYKVTDASGRFTGALTEAGSNGKLAWTLSFAKLSGPVTVAYVDVPRTGKSGEVVVQLCRQCASGAKGVVTPLTASVTKAISTSTSYVVIRTKKNPNGEIRGRIALTRS